jgi:UDP-N-acetylglucosamine 2-epimerase (non-hydrolysing)
MVRMLLVAGARPNFMKIASVIEESRRRGVIKPILVHTGQHYDPELSDTFFQQLGIPEPDYYLGVGSGTHGQQTARAIAGIDRILPEAKPDFIAVVGDVNSTLAGAVVAGMRRIPLVHIEAGYRTHDLNQPEEINRQVADTLSSYFFPSTQFAAENLFREGVAPERVFMAGDINLDPMFRLMPEIDSCRIVEDMGLAPGGYIFSTLHRPESVDRKEVLKGIMEAFDEISKRIRVILPLHPRTARRAAEFGIPLPARITVTKPLPYIQTVRLMKSAALVITDSGGIQDETTALGVPCLTLREHTERPETVKMGTNRLIGTDRERIIRETKRILDGDKPRGRVPELWDGRTGERIVRVLEEIFT